MRVLLIALLAAISYAQTDVEFAVGVRSVVRENAEETFSWALRLTDNNFILTVPPDPRLEVTKQVLVRFLEPIRVESGSVTFECMANTELIAFKLMRSIRGHSCHLVQHPGMPEYMTTREIRTMKYLHHMLMEEFLKPKLGSQLQIFSMESIQYQGFGLEYFPHPSVLEVIGARMNAKTGCGFIYCFRSKWEVRKDILLNSEFYDIYQVCLDALMKMWTLGVVHGDISPESFLYDSKSNKVKMKDFDRSTIYRDRETELEFLLGLAKDFLEFTMMFAAAVMYTHIFHRQDRREVLSGMQITRLKSIAVELNPDLAAVIQGNLPHSPKFQAVYLSFRARNGITSPQIPTTSQIREAAIFNNFLPFMDMPSTVTFSGSSSQARHDGDQTPDDGDIELMEIQPLIPESEHPAIQRSPAVARRNSREMIVQLSAKGVRVSSIYPHCQGNLSFILGGIFIFLSLYGIYSFYSIPFQDALHESFIHYSGEEI